MTDTQEAVTGGCSCGHVCYTVTASPMIVHCCHCSWCQRQTGSAFAVNALIEAEYVSLSAGDVETLTLDTPSGNGQPISRCPLCHVAVWSNYHMGGLRERIRFIRVGTLDQPDLMPPDIHIYTCSKQAWLRLPEQDRYADLFYIYEETWRADALARRAVLLADAGITV